jgi:hypothetical protein
MTPAIIISATILVCTLIIQHEIWKLKEQVWRLANYINEIKNKLK